jgi:hypothetical protein
MLLKMAIALLAYYIGRADMSLDDFLMMITWLVKFDDKNNKT